SALAAVLGAVVGEQAHDVVEELARQELVAEPLAREPRRLEILRAQRRRQRDHLDALALKQPAEQLRVLLAADLLEAMGALRGGGHDRVALMSAQPIPRTIRQEHAA